MKQNYFEKVTTLEELKSTYRKLAVKLHPDNGGNVKDMQELNAQYDVAFARVKDKHRTKDGKEYTKETDEAPSYFRDLIDKLIKLNVTIEIIGSFVWVSGNTKEVKEELKALGFKWHTQKVMWYLSPPWYVKKSKAKYTMDQVRDMFGVQYERQQTDEKPADEKPAEKQKSKPVKKRLDNGNQYYEQQSL